MQLRDLEYFAAVAREGSFSRASASLGLSPAALSKSLVRLEATVDAKLVSRASKGVALTSAGKLLLARVQKLRLSVEDVKREASEVGAGRAGELRVGMNQIDSERITAACTDLLKEAPELSFKLVVSNNDVMIPQLHNGELDVVISLLPDAPFEGTEHEILLHDKLAVCASASHPLAKRRRVSLADVAQERWIVAPSDVFTRQRLLRAFEARGLPAPRVAFEARQMQIRVTALDRSRTVSLLQSRVIGLAAAAGIRLVKLPVRELVSPISLGAIWRKDGYLPRSAQRLIRLLRSSVRWTV